MAPKLLTDFSQVVESVDGFFNGTIFRSERCLFIDINGIVVVDVFVVRSGLAVRVNCAPGSLPDYLKHHYGNHCIQVGSIDERGGVLLEIC